MVARMYLLQSRTVIRMVLANGSKIDVPISGIRQTNFNPGTTYISYNMNNRIASIALNRSTNVDLTLLWAIGQSNVT